MEVISRLSEFHETAVAVSEGAGERPAFAEWIGVGERSHLAAYFKFAIGVEFQEQQRRISAFDQSLQGFVLTGDAYSAMVPSTTSRAPGSGVFRL